MEQLHRLSFIQIFVVLFHPFIKRNLTSVSQLFSPQIVLSKNDICATTLVLST